MRAAADQSEDINIVEDMAVQGREKPQTYAPFQDFLTGQQTVVICAFMEEGQMTITPLHLVTHFATAAHHHDCYNGSILGAVGERQGEEDPTWVKLKRIALQWENIPRSWGGGKTMSWHHGTAPQTTDSPHLMQQPRQKVTWSGSQRHQCCQWRW
mmetsp:Transcript_33000/g.69246  ORF Transcript_33000/g.69246 Transcript_33000/m.69246 type:complete len:155 (+) Transcript_33000:365-829(+)